MKKMKRIAYKFIALLVLVLTISLVGCGDKPMDIDELQKNWVLVVYDGNGGYLGNKTAKFRKLYAEVNSVIPEYLTELSDSQYVASGLGLAMKEGYNLAGWYIDDAEHIKYVKDETGYGEYILLNNGNGIFTLDDNGDYVCHYEKSEQGKYVLFDVEQPASEGDQVDYVYLNGAFKIYDSENNDHIIYKEEHGLISGNALKGLIGYVQKSYVTDEKVLEIINDPSVDKYNMRYVQFNNAVDKEDEQKYSLKEGYAKIDVMFEEDEEGKYVLLGDNFVFYNSEHAELTRYSIKPEYVFFDETKTPSDYDRYKSEIIYWQFDKDRITEEMKEKGGITLKADWHKKLTVYFVYEDYNNMIPGEKRIVIDEYAKDSEGNDRYFNYLLALTSKMNKNNTGSIPLSIGDTLTKPVQQASYSGYTFMNWSKSPDENDPWDFENDVIPEGTSTLYLYAAMLKGEYTLIKTASDLEQVAKNPSGKYLLCNDIDLNGAKYNNKTPLGFEINTTGANVVFTGELKGLTGTEKIKNFTITANNFVKEVNEDKSKAVAYGLIPYAYGALISGVEVENANVVITTKGVITQPIGNNVSAAGLIGKALSFDEVKNDQLFVQQEFASNKKTTINSCKIDITFEPKSSDAFAYTLLVGDILAEGNDNCTITDSSTTYNIEKLSTIGTYDTNFTH